MDNIARCKMNILIITPDYPDRYKVHYPFVKQLVDEFARQGHRCFVNVPYSITKNKRFYPAKEFDGNVMVYRPNYLSFSREVQPFGSFPQESHYESKQMATSQA